MPGSVIGEFILGPILEFIFGVVCYYIGCIVLPILSLGWLRCDRLTADTSRKKKRWGGFYHKRGHQIYITADATSLAGLLTVFLVGAIIGFYVWLAKVQ